MVRASASDQANRQRDRGRNLLYVMVSVLVAVTAVVLLMAGLVASRLDAVTGMVRQSGALLQISLDGAEVRLDDMGRQLERLLSETGSDADPDGAAARLADELSRLALAPGLPGTLRMDAVLADGSHVAVRMQDTAGTGSFVADAGIADVGNADADLADGMALSVSADGSRGGGGTFWGEGPASGDASGSKSVDTIYRPIAFPGGEGLLRLTFDLDGVAAHHMKRMLIPVYGWVAGDGGGRLLSWRIPFLAVPSGTLTPPTQADWSGEAAALLDEADALSSRLGLFRNLDVISGSFFHVFPESLRNGWRFVAVFPSQTLFAEQIGILWAFVGMTALLLLLLLGARHQERRRLTSDIRSAVDAFGRYPTAFEQAQEGARETAGSAERVTAAASAMPPDALQEPELPEDSEVAVLVMAARNAFEELRRQYGALEGESVRNRQLASDISRFYSHVRVLNGQGFRIDFFEYHVRQHRFLFMTGLATLFGTGSQIYREMDDAEFFERFACSIRLQDAEAGREPDELDAGRTLAEFRTLAADCLASGNPFSLEMRAMSMDDGVLWLRCWGRPDADTGRIDGALLDITGEVRQRAADLNRFMTDGITGFYNRNALTEVGGRILAEREPGEILTFLYFGLRQYGDFEARFGMVAANGYIRTFAEMLRSRMTDRHVMFRWWGPDFLCIVRGFHSVEAVLENGRRIMGDVISQRRSVNGVLADFPVAVGYAVAGIHGDTPTELLEHAAFAEHEVISGQAQNLNEFNRIRYDEARQVALRRSFIRDMIERNDLYVVYQPIVSLKTGEIFGFEALSRPANRIYRNIGELIDDAEDTGHYAILERRMVYNALDGFMERPEQYRDAWLFINTAPTQSLTEADYLDIRDRYFSFMHVVYEVIERNRIDPDEMLRRKAMVRGTGAKFALDDFGSGYSNHLALLALEPDIIKIDRGLVQGVDCDPRKQQMLEDIIGYARQGGTRVLAEGVETRGELAALCRMGVDYAQGFHLARPAVAFGSVSEEAASVIQAMVRTIHPDTGHAVAVACKTFSLRDPGMGQHALAFGWFLLRLATEWGMAPEDALRFSIAGILYDAAALLDDLGDWRAMGDDEAMLRAHTAAGLAESFLPEWPWAQALRQPSDRGARPSDAARLLLLADRLAFCNLAKGDAQLDERFQQILSQMDWTEGRRLAGPLSQLAGEVTRNVPVEAHGFPGHDPSSPHNASRTFWMDEWLLRLHGMQASGDLTEGLLRLLVNVVDARSLHMSGHAAEMEKVAEMLAVMLKQGWRMAERIRLAALCRDLGNLAVPASLFDKQGRLSVEEMDQFRTLAIRSRDLLASVGLSELAELQAPTVDRMSHPEAPLEKDVAQGRAILAVSDVLTALLANRAWRPAMTRAQAAAVLTEMAAGGMLDPLVAETAVENLDTLADGIQHVRRALREMPRPGSPRLLAVSGGLMDSDNDRSQ